MIVHKASNAIEFRRRDLCRFNPNNALCIDLICYLLELFQRRDTDLCDAFNLVSGDGGFQIYIYYIYIYIIYILVLIV